MPKDFWWKDAVFYELYVDKFAGDFPGLISRLDYLKKLGVGCLHILPHYPSPMIDDGYDVSDYMAVRKELGSIEDFRRFASEAHHRGIRVLIDFVLNHVSTDHPWFLEASSSKDNPKKSFFLWSETGEEYKGAANPFYELKPSNWIKNSRTGDYYFSTFYPQQADLNWDNPEVFEKMMDVVDFWLGLGVDGFRLDAASHLIKREGSDCKHLPETHAIIKKIRAHIEKNNKDVILLTEADGLPEIIKEYFGNGDEAHLSYNFPLVKYFFRAIADGSFKINEEFMESVSRIPESCQWAIFLGHHDELPLRDAELLEHFDPEKKFIFNNGLAMRLSNILRGDEEKIRNAFKMLFDTPGAPIIYYGAEIGMRNIELTKGEKDYRKALRGAFDWRAADLAARDPNSLFSWIAQLIRGASSVQTPQ
jgi:maltose alpha-D-glucosyltransferase/alpha-amylase